VCVDPFAQRLRRHFLTALAKLGLSRAQLSEQFDVHPNQITSWKAQLEGGAADVFGAGGGATPLATRAADYRARHPRALDRRP
jgi:transposase